MKRLEQTYEIKAPLEKVWQALVDPKMIEQWSGAPAKMSDEPGAEFALWSGDIFGKNLEVKPPKLLVQEWSDNKFSKPSEVRFELTGGGFKTTVRLVQTNLADDRYDDISAGWRDYYLGPLQDMLER